MSDDLYENEAERQWSQASSIRGVDRELLDARQRPEPDMPRQAPAAFSPWLIPVAAILTGPPVAALLALFADGDPPRGRHVVAILSVALCAWLVNMGLASPQFEALSPAIESALRLGILTTTGVGLWAMYVFWMKGKQAVDRRALINSAVLVGILSALFWFGHNTAWWTWMGR